MVQKMFNIAVDPQCPEEKNPVDFVKKGTVFGNKMKGLKLV
jgi:hypothetical protein